MIYLDEIYREAKRIELEISEASRAGINRIKTTVKGEENITTKEVARLLKEENRKIERNVNELTISWG